MSRQMTIKEYENHIPSSYRGNYRKTMSGKSKATVCRWKKDKEDGVYDTNCGNRFEFNADGPTENHFKFCPYCGKKLKNFEKRKTI